jgi:hypothetical protein
VSRDALVARGRIAAEAGMRDSCTIRRASGGTTNPVTGLPTQPYTTLYTGRCRVQQVTASASPADVGEDHVLLLGLVVQLPMSVTGLEVGDQITIDASADPDLVARVLLIESLAHKTDATARRVGVKERTG